MKVWIEGYEIAPWTDEQFLNLIPTFKQKP
jgi:hypothetical protein